jgi:hypothetical protein
LARLLVRVRLMPILQRRETYLTSRGTMKKLKLNVEELDVVEFKVEDTERETKGTVHGHGPSYFWSGCLVCPREPDTWSCGC